MQWQVGLQQVLMTQRHLAGRRHTSVLLSGLDMSASAVSGHPVGVCAGT